MDEHSIKKKLYLSKIFAISAETPGLLVPLVEIVKAYPIDVLDAFFSKINQSGSDLYLVYKDKCHENNDELAIFILNM
jgi:hypothetical protein